MNNYIDCHSHILFGIDDGAKTVEDSIEIIKKLKELGFNEIILTPHYKNVYQVNNKEKRKRFRTLNARLKKEKIDTKLYLANEVRITSNILDLKEKDEISLLNNNLFLELPFNVKIFNLEKIIYELECEDINIILVHPERYTYLSKKDYEKLINQDVVFQVNYESIIGTYGRTAQKRAVYLLKNKMTTFLGTDIHEENSNLIKYFDKIKIKIIKLIGEEEFNNLTYNNIKKIIKK